MPAEFGEHVARVRGIARLSEDYAIHLDGCVRAHDDAIARAFRNLRGGGACFLFRKSRNHGLRPFARKSRFINVGWANFKRDSRGAQDFRAARRRGGKDDFHIRSNAR